MTFNTRYIWVSSWGPTYNNSCRICVALASIVIILCWVFRRHLERLNEAAQAEERKLRLPKGYRYML
ncbi:hypothetical protein BD769DRAFT_1425562 [Suillus cothurnatus]|nr:hypothetical protein BD769DRAFT_1425562 [Suillus cothurnatus]